MLEKQSDRGRNRSEPMKHLLKSIDRKIVLHVAGCGSNALRELCIHSGSSRVVLEGGQFYSRGSLEMELFEKNSKSTLSKFVSQNTSEQMAYNAFCKGQNILTRQREINYIGNSLGIGLTGQIGHHRISQAFLSIHSMKYLRTFHLEFPSNTNLSTPAENPSDQLKTTLINECSYNMLDYLQRDDQINNIVIYRVNNKENNSNRNQSNEEGEFVFAVNQNLNNCVLFSGSFNPIHEGHIDIALESKKLRNRDKVFFEMPLKNADKPDKNQDTLLSLIRQIFKKIESDYSKELPIDEFGVVISKRSLFIEKCNYVSNSSFALGIDTFKRILDKKYYNDSEEERIAALATFKKAEVDLVIAPRLNASTQQMESISNFNDLTPSFLKSSVIELQNYRNDISSTLLRSQNIQNISSNK